ncbi:histidine--tRNA ligase [Flavobacterium sp. FBOR7N2.3]|uniref:Histidine--tRNA ligase n=1 Tax=Flavobacterium magnesitis TaxID=3138077 RepID=A0ABV4TM97_9FLAO
MASKPSIPKGTRDFSPAEVAKRQYIIQTIKSNFEKFGFQPIETPSFENSETLMGKYGEEGDRLIFKILNSGDYLGEIKNILSIYLNSVFKNVVTQLSLRLSQQNVENFYEEKIKSISNLSLEDNRQEIEIIIDRAYEKVLEKLVSEDFIEKLVSEMNSKYNYEFKLQNFYSDELKDIILEEISSLKSSKVLNKNIYNAIKDCESCDIADSEVVKEFIERRVFRVLGKYFTLIESKKLTTQISEKALRYDLTVPFARYVVQHQNEIEFPFKRYQIQPVWRADRPQKGRFREFFQCDADVVGSKSLWQEVELVQLYDTVFSTLGLNGVTVKINNRKILSGIAEVIGASDKLIDFTVALDKLDKIGEDGVKKEMIEKGISEDAIVKVQPLFNFTGSISEKIEKLSQLLAASEEGMKGVEELRFICDNVTKLGLATAILDLDVTLARGLNYYTGAIFEVAAPKGVAMGSIGGGGRYDDLTGIFDSKNKMSGVGISFGLDRIYLVIEELGLFPETVTASSKALFINYGDQEAFYALQAIKKLRSEGIKVELYPDNVKVGKQFQHADKRNIPFAVIVGGEEMSSNTYSLKNLVSGEQVILDFEGLKNALV